MLSLDRDQWAFAVVNGFGPSYFSRHFISWHFAVKKFLWIQTFWSEFKIYTKFL